jgi:hypothetical protein
MNTGRSGTALFWLLLGAVATDAHAAEKATAISAELASNAPIGAQLELPLTSSTSVTLEYVRVQSPAEPVPLVGIDQTLATTVKLGVTLRFAE